MIFSSANKSSLFDFKNSHLIPLVILAITTLMTFSNSFHNEFLMDDNEVIKQSFYSPYQFLDIKAFQNKEIYFRPLTYFFYGAHYALFEDVGYKYHVVNLFWFFLSVVTFYFLVFRIFNDKSLAFLAAAFYSVHPFNGVLVNYKSAVGAVFLVFAMNMSMLKFLAYLDRGRRIWDFGIGLLWFFIALMSYELAIMYPMFVMLVLIFRGKNDWKRSLIVMGGVLCVWFMYILFCFYNSLFFSHVWDESKTFNLVAPIYFGLFAKLMAWYVQQLTFMNSIVLVWNAEIALGKVWSWITLLSGSFLGACLIIYYRHHWPRFAFGLTWMILGVFPLVMGCFVRSEMGFIVEPHWLVYSSFGFFILLASVLLFLRRKLNRHFWLSLVICLLMVCMVKSWNYNNLWGSQLKYCSYWKNISPNIALVRAWLGEAYVFQRKYKEAYSIFYEAIQEEKFKQFGKLYAHLGGCAFYLKDYELSLEYFKKTLSLNLDYADIHYYIGLNQMALGYRDLAKEEFKRAVQMDPTLMEAKQKLDELSE